MGAKDLNSSSGPFELSTTFINRGEVLKGDGFLRFCEASEDFTYRKRDFLFRSGTWRGLTQEPEFLKAGKTGFRGLVVGHSDIHTTRYQQILLRSIGVQKFWGTNLHPIEGFSESLPLGISNSERSSIGHSISSDIEVFMDVVRQVDFCKEYRPSFYVNMTTANNTKTRIALMRAIESSGFEASIHEPSLSREAMSSYLRNMRESPLTPCPEGNGVDTHRFWECLYVGGTPVVVKNKSMDSLYGRVPAVVLNSWSEIRDSRLLEKLWHDARSKLWQKEVLSLKFWTNRIGSSISAQAS